MLSERVALRVFGMFSAFILCLALVIHVGIILRGQGQWWNGASVVLLAEFVPVVVVSIVRVR